MKTVNIVTNSSLYSQRSPSQNDEDDEGSEPPFPVIPVDPDACVLPNATLCAFTVLDTMLVTLAQGPAHWKVQLFRCPGPGQDPGPSGQISEVDLASCTPLARSPGEPKAPVFLPVLCCVSPPGPRVPRGHPRGSGAFTLEGSLFGLLFGADAALLESPVLLVGLPSGQLCCVVLKTLGTSGLATGDLKGTAKVLHHLEEPVLFIGALRTEPLAEDTEDTYSDCLVALGHHGRTLAIKAGRDEAGSLDPVLREYCLPGPVLCAACGGDGRLYHSTPSGLCVVDLARPSTGPESLPSLPCPASLSVCSVLTLSVSSGVPEGTSRGFIVKNRRLGVVGAPRALGCFSPLQPCLPRARRAGRSSPGPAPWSAVHAWGPGVPPCVLRGFGSRHAALPGRGLHPVGDPGLWHLSVTGPRPQAIQGRFGVFRGKPSPSYQWPENASALATRPATQPAPRHTVWSRLCACPPPGPVPVKMADCPRVAGRPAVDSSQRERKALKGKATARCRRSWGQEGPGASTMPRAAGLPLPA